MSMNCSFACPILTELSHNGIQYVCEYEEWAYGLAAALLCFGGLVPLVLIVSFWAKLKNASVKTRKKLHRQDSEASTFTDVSRPHDHSVYEVIRNADAEDLIYRTRKGGLSSHKYGTFSVPNFRTYDNSGITSRHLYPDLTEVSFPDSRYSNPVTPTKQGSSCGFSSRFSSEETIPPRLARKRRKKDLAESRIVKFQRPKRRHRQSSLRPTGKSSDPYRSKYAKRSAARSSSSSSFSSEEGLTMGHQGKDVPKRQPTYDAIVPPADMPKVGLPDCPSFQPTPPVKHLVDRMDFDEYLKDCVAKLPEDLRNGTYLIRDSQSEPGCKVLALYCKGVSPAKVLFHFKLCFAEKKAFISGSFERFSTLEEMLDYYRKQRTVLPCLLSNCLGLDF